RPVNKKQGSDGEVTFLRYVGFKEETIKEGQERHIEYSLDLYKDMIEAGVAPEMARMVLPQNMMTSFWWSGSLDAFADMCKLRCKPDAQ
ncbi:FAD-dependent thymidylate synthase, partial [Streptococcus pneumoniae]